MYESYLQEFGGWKHKEYGSVSTLESSLMKKKNIQISGSADKPILIDVTYKANAQPKQIVVFCHGFKGFKDWGPFNKIARHFAQQNIVFVKFKPFIHLKFLLFF